MAASPDAVQAAPDVYTAVFENDRVRILRPDCWYSRQLDHNFTEL